MTTLNYKWEADGSEHTLQLVRVAGTEGEPFLFGRGPDPKPIHITSFYLTTTPVTQALWSHVMGSNPACHRGPDLPIENVSWNHVCESAGFLDRLNSSDVRNAVSANNPHLQFRLPSETEWEYAARGGPNWKDNFTYSGSNNPDEVAWYGARWTRALNAAAQVFGWRFAWRTFGGMNRKRPTHTHAVARKAPNQLGIYDMSGNVWEWCQDVCTDELSVVPDNGSAYEGAGDERRLRGGCHHNWNLHCTVAWRYGIAPDAHDGCIGFRLLLGPAGNSD